MATISHYKSGYYKFNNSRSVKYPFWIHIHIDQSGIVQDTCGHIWMIRNPYNLIPITEEEFNKVKASVNKDFKIGDKIIVLEYCSYKKRFGVIKDIKPYNINNEYFWITLTDGRIFFSNDVVKEGFIYQS